MGYHAPGFNRRLGIIERKMLNISRLIRGTPGLRKTRFHDEKGNLVDLAGMAYAPLALATALLRVGIGYRPRQPMISFRAARFIDSLLKGTERGVEFGSGASTVWLARRCSFLLSIEDDPHWWRWVQKDLSKFKLDHVRHELRQAEDYADLDSYPEGSFDFALVDGSDRARCVKSLLPKLRPGGWIYLDNSDKDMTRPGKDLRQAEDALLEAAKIKNGKVRYFTDFSPTNFFVEQGMWVKL